MTHTLTLPDPHVTRITIDDKPALLVDGERYLISTRDDGEWPNPDDIETLVEQQPTWLSALTEPCQTCRPRTWCRILGVGPPCPQPCGDCKPSAFGRAGWIFKSRDLGEPITDGAVPVMEGQWTRCLDCHDGRPILVITEPCECEGDPRHQCCGKVPDMVSHRYTVTEALPVFDKCPDYTPADHVCRAWGDGALYWHRSERRTDDNTEIRLGTFDATPGQFVVLLDEVTP